MGYQSRTLPRGSSFQREPERGREMEPSYDQRAQEQPRVEPQRNDDFDRGMCSHRLLFVFS